MDEQDKLRICLSEVPKVKKKLLSNEKVKKTSTQMKLLAHPTRLQILKLLSEKDLCVCVLSEVLGKTQPNVSQHLAKLRDNKIIESYYVGKFAYYKLTDKEIRNFIKAL